MQKYMQCCLYDVYEPPPGLNQNSDENCQTLTKAGRPTKGLTRDASFFFFEKSKYMEHVFLVPHTNPTTYPGISADAQHLISPTTWYCCCEQHSSTLFTKLYKNKIITKILRHFLLATQKANCKLSQATS